MALEIKICEIIGEINNIKQGQNLLIECSKGKISYLTCNENNKLKIAIENTKFKQKELKSRLGVGVGAVFRINKLFLTSYVQFPAPKLSIDAELWWRHFLFGFGCEYQLAVGFVPKITLHYSFESRSK